MTALSVQPPFPILTDIDGQPLDDGFIFIGVANNDPIANPITVYWDASLTVTATQPIRTRGGYPMNAGVVGRLYVNSDYSIQVQNRNGSIVYSAPVQTERFGNIISGASLPRVQFFGATPPGAPAVGNAYAVISPATGAWLGKENRIATWNGISWDFYPISTPLGASDNGLCVVDLSNKQNQKWTGAGWENLGAAQRITASTFDGQVAFGAAAASSFPALKIGGGDLTQGTTGNTFGADGHGTWTRMQPSVDQSSTEFVIYGTQKQIRMRTVVGTNRLERLEGSVLDAAMVGRRIYFEKTTYRVLALISSSEISVTTDGGGAVTFGLLVTGWAVAAQVWLRGTAQIIGTRLIRIAGDPFIPFIAYPFEMRLGGVIRTVNAFVDESEYTLATAPGDVASIAYEATTDIDSQLVSFRLQRILGANEENLTITVKMGGGYFIRSQIAGNGNYQSISLGSGEWGPGSLAEQIVLQSDGWMSLGGNGYAFSNDTMRFNPPALGVATNRIDVLSSSVGSNAGPILATRGSDASVDMLFDTKGVNSKIRFTTNSFEQVAFEIFRNAGASWFGVGGNTIYLQGAATNIDAYLGGKGTGTTWLGGNSITNPSVGVLSQASIVNTLQLTGAPTGSGAGLRSRGTDANVNMTFDTQGTSSFFQFTHNSFGSVGFEIYRNTGASWLGVGNNTIYAQGAASNIDAYFGGKGTGTTWLGGNSTTNPSVGVLSAASIVNTLQLTGAPTGFSAGIRARGSDANVGIGLDTQGTGSVTITSGSFARTGLQVFATVSSVNWLTISPSITANPVTLSAVGSDANIDILLAPKGAGRVRLGDFTAGAPIANGTIEIKDSVGNIRKVMIAA